MITDEEINKGLSILKMIWFAMLAALCILLIVGLQVGENLQSSMDQESLGIVKWVLYGVAFVNLIVSRFIRRIVLSVGLRNATEARSYQYPVMQKYTVASIIAWALSVSVGIDGLVLFFLGKSTTDLCLLILVAVAALFIYRPNRDEIMNLSAAAATAIPTPDS